MASATFLLLLAVLAGAASALTDKPNILMIPIDDLNNWVSCCVVWLVIFIYALSTWPHLVRKLTQHSLIDSQ